MKKLLFTLVLLTTTASAYSQLLNWNATQNKANSISPKGDANGDGEVDISDVVFVVNEILSGDSYQESCDVNGDGYVDISDVVELVNIILNGNQTNLCPDNNHPHMIDLGLPSGTKWACCNVGASSPEGYGGYYAWGETEEKSEYCIRNYKYVVLDDNNGIWYDKGHYYLYQSIGSDISGTQYDVAHVKWGGDWHMPTLAQIQELLNNTTSEWTSENGVAGIKFMGSNGGSIFLPAAGVRWDSGHNHVGNYGLYWSSTLHEYYEGGAYDANYLFFGSDYSVDWFYDYRYYGRSVRPVR